jgi:branched-chain amino acid transport system ATP-binding protein
LNADLPALEVRALTVRFRGVLAVRDFELCAHGGTLTVLTGPNGAGKSTVLNAITGTCPRSSGTIAVGGCRVSGNWAPHHAYAAGIRRSFQVPRHWPSLSLLENVALASAIPRHHLQERLAILLPGVDPERSPVALSLGQRRLLEILRLEVAQGDCRLALFDEPLSGLDEENVATVAAKVEAMRSRGSAVVVVDHHPEHWPNRNATVVLPVPSAAAERS